MGESTWSWSKTAASNASADSSINWAEGQSPGTVNNSARSMMAAEAKLRDDQGGALTLAGGTTAYTLTTNQVLATLADGVRVHAVVNATNTGASTLAVDSLTAKAIRRLDDAVGDIAIAAGELPKNFHAVFQYDASANSAAGAWVWINAPRRPAKGHINGLTLSNNGSDATNDIDIAAGVATDSTGTVSMVLSSAITKQLDATWAVGTNAGGKSSAAAIANTTYHVYLIYRSDTGVVDVCMDVSASGPTMPTSYTHYRRIGSIVRETGAIVSFLQEGDYFRRATPATDVNTTNPGTSAVTVTHSIPTGLLIHALFMMYSASTTVGTSYFCVCTPLAISDAAASSGNFTHAFRSGPAAGTYFNATPQTVRTNTSAQTRYRFAASDANLTVVISTIGWIDTRGVDS